MKLRIITNGNFYKVQYKAGPLWRDCQTPYGPSDTVPVMFSSREAIRDWIREEFGSSAELSDEWWPINI